MTPQLKTVLGTYFRRRLIWFGAALYVSQIVGFLGAVHSRHLEPMMLMMVCFTCGWPAAVIGFHAKQQFADPRSALLPGFRRPHVLALVIMTAVVILPIPLIAAFSGHGLLGLLAVCLAYYACVFAWAAIQHGVWSVFLFVAVIAPYTDSARQAFDYLVNGRDDGLAAAIVMAGACLLVTVIRRLAKMTEDDPSYGRQFQTNAWDLHARGARRKAMAAYYANGNMENRFWLWLAGTGLPEHATYIGQSRQRRMRHWLKGWPNTRGALVAMVAFMLMVMWWLQSEMGPGNRSVLVAQFWVFVPFPQATLLSFYQFRANSMGWESLRPISRRDYVLEMGLVALLGTLYVWGTAIACLLLAGALTGFTAIDLRTLLVFALVTGSTQIPAFAVMTRVLGTRKLWAAYVCLMLVALFGALIITVCLHTEAVRLGVGLSIALLLSGVLLLRRSFRFWCTAELT